MCAQPVHTSKAQQQLKQGGVGREGALINLYLLRKVNATKTGTMSTHLQEALDIYVQTNVCSTYTVKMKVIILQLYLPSTIN